MTELLLKTRFCPSPTGFIHLGNTRTALFNVLLARKVGGQFLLRIEDTDLERSEPRYTEALMSDLHWLDYGWQEGPDHDLGRGPYWQSQRQSIYDGYYQQLETAGLAYPCFCSPEDLALSRKLQRAAGKPPRYAGTCCALTPEEIQEKIAAGLKPVLRFSLKHESVIEFDDLVRGKQSFQTKDIGDFIIRRTDGTSPFMFCNAIDDALMGVTHALRGEDHLTNTPCQIAILNALGLRAPQYGHITLIVGDDGSPLSKRHGSRSIQELRQSGYLPLAINNYLARLGHHYTNDGFMTMQELSSEFKTESLSKSPARFDAEQLNYWQKEAVQRLNENEFWEWLGDSGSEVPESKKDLFVHTIKSNIRFPIEAHNWSQHLFKELLEYGTEEQAILDSAGKSFFAETLIALEREGRDYKKIVEHLQSQLNIKGKGLFQPLRVALTGQLHGPEMVALLEMMDENLIKARLKKLC